MWDGRSYSACFAAAAEQFTAEALRCASHASQAYAAVMATAQMLAPNSSIPGLVINTVLFLAACAGYQRLLRLIFPSADPVDRALLTAVFTVHPAFLAAVVQPSLDLPLLPGIVWSVVFALERRWIPLILTGLAVGFTKESGLLLYAAVIACYAIWFVWRGNRPVVERALGTLRLAPLALPGIVFCAYLLYRRATVVSQPVLWYAGSTGDSLLSQFLLPHLDLYQVNYAVLLLVLQFAWIPAVTIGLDAFVGSVRGLHRLPRRPVPAADASGLGFLVLLTIVVGWLVTRFTTFGHTRYFLAVYALLLTMYFASLSRLGIGPRARRSILAVHAVALLASNVRTVDPISRSLYGTFAFGSHDLLRMTAVTHECCGYGQDQLAYNLQFTELQALVDTALADIAMETPTIVVPDSTVWLFTAYPAGWPRHVGDRNSRSVEALDHRRLVRGVSRPDTAFYFAMPNGDNVRARAGLIPLYDFTDERRYERGGYVLSTFRITRRSTQP
jgi:hypothetical protein